MSLAGFLKEQKNFVARERMLHLKATLEMKVAAASSGEQLLMTEPEIDNNGFDLTISHRYDGCIHFGEAGHVGKIDRYADKVVQVLACRKILHPCIRCWTRPPWAICGARIGAHCPMASLGRYRILERQE